MDVMSRKERAARIEHEMREAKEYMLVPFRGAMAKAEVVRVPVGLPIYRVHNGRTRVEQFIHIERNGLPHDFFLNSEEDAVVQEAQNAILLRMSKDPKGDIYSEMGRIAEQRGALIATRSGVIVNGNRRLAAMRDLHSRNTDDYSKFEYVDLAVLPSETNERDIEDVETELQEVPETKLDYGWIERRLKIRYQLEDLNVDRSQLRTKYRLRSDEDVTKEVAQLALAEEYLNYIGKPSYHYWEVAQSEEIFKRLQAALSKYADNDAEVRRLIGFALIKGSSDKSIRDRVYRFHTIFGDDFEKVIDRYVEECTEADESEETPPPVAVPIETPPPQADPLLTFVPPDNSRLEVLRENLRSPETATNVAKDLVNVFKAMLTEEEEEDLRRAALVAASNANRLLQEISLDSADSSTFDALRSQLQSAVHAAERILHQLTSIAKSAE